MMTGLLNPVDIPEASTTQLNASKAVLSLLLLPTEWLFSTE